MKEPKQPKKSRHGMVAEDKKQTSVTMKKETLAAARAAAKKDNRSLSNWLEQVAKKALENGMLSLVF